MNVKTFLLSALFVVSEASDLSSSANLHGAGGDNEAKSRSTRGIRGNGSDKGNGNGMGNGVAFGVDKGYNDVANDIYLRIKAGQLPSQYDVKQLMNKYKQTRLKVDKKKKLLKDAAAKALEKNKNKNVTDYDFVMETLLEVTDEELQLDLLKNLKDGYALPGPDDVIEPRAGELEDMDNLDVYEDPAEDGEGRRLGVPTNKKKWADGIIKYTVVLESDFSGYLMWALRIIPAMTELEELTTLRFEFAGSVSTESEATQDGTVYLRKRSSGCSASLGAPEYYVHYIDIGPLCDHGIILHELLHTAGMHHQQVGLYRDKYVTVNPQNIEPGKYDPNFKELYNHGFEFVYDYGSIMHYGEYSFSNNGQKTIDCHGKKCGQRISLSFWDMLEINYYYSNVYYVNGSL